MDTRHVRQLACSTHVFIRAFLAPFLARRRQRVSAVYCLGGPYGADMQELVAGLESFTAGSRTSPRASKETCYLGRQGCWRGDPDMCNTGDGHLLPWHRLWPGHVEAKTVAPCYCSVR